MIESFYHIKGNFYYQIADDVHFSRFLLKEFIMNHLWDVFGDLLFGYYFEKDFLIYFVFSEFIEFGL